MTEAAAPPVFHIQIARNLPVSNTGSVVLTFRRAGVAPIVVPIKQSAILHPGDYQVTAPGTPPIVIANIYYDTGLHSFTVKVAGDAREAQFSVLVNLSDIQP